MALDAGFGGVDPIVVAGQRSRGAKEGRKTVREGTLRASKADGIGAHAPICLIVPKPLGTIGMSVRSFAPKPLQAQIVDPEIHRPVSAIPWTLLVDRR